MMNTLALHTRENPLRTLSGLLQEIDLIAFIGLIIFTNTHLLTGGTAGAYIFLPDAFMSGQWWRLLTHPFVHLTWYHLLLDAGAFFLLYKELSGEGMGKRLFYVLFTGLSALAAAMMAAPGINTLGLCGLSGIAHGLMAVSALKMMREEKDFRTGLVFLVVVVSKSIYEAAVGDVLFSFMHFGLCGTPLAVCHGGGVLGGITAFFITRGNS